MFSIGRKILWLENVIKNKRDRLIQALSLSNQI